MKENFVDYVKIYCKSGKGGAGSAHLHRDLLTSKGGPDEATFMTGLLNEERDKTIKMYEDLNVLVDMIDTHFDHVLERHELDFMNAYKGHMVKV